jgi:putative ABC transport system permease protein
MPTEWLTKIRYLFRRKGRNEVDEELQFHFDQLVKSKIGSGIDPEEARRQARVEFGTFDSTREQCEEQRPSHIFETIAQDLRYAVRGFVRNPAFALSVVFTLTLGIGSTTAVFSVVDKILFRPLPYADAERLVSVGMTAPILPQEFLLGGTYYDWRDHNTSFDSFSSETGVAPCDLTENNPARIACASVESGFLTMLGVNPVVGRNFARDEDRPHAPRVALISYSLWKERFARDPGVMGKLINLDGQDVRIVGVLPANFEMPTLEAADVLIPQAIDETEQRHAEPGRVFYAFARLKPGVTIEQAAQQMQSLFEQSLHEAPPQFRKEIHLRVRSVRDRQMHDVHVAAWMLFGVVLTVLLISCANASGLFIARTAAREREFAVRAALGARRRRLVQQAWTESMALAMVSAFLGIAFGYVLLRTLIAVAPQGMPFLANTHLDLRIISFSLGVSLLCGAFCGLLAVMHWPRPEALAGRTSISVPHARLRQSLVMAQIAASMVLLAGGALLFRSFRNLENQRLGIRTEHLVTASVSLGQKNYPTPERQMAFFQQLTSRVEHGPGIHTFALSDSIPPGGWHHEHIRASIVVNGVRFSNGTGGLVAWRWATPNYFRILGIPLLRGSGFTTEQQDSAEHFIVLSQALAAQLFPGTDPIGQHLQVAGGEPEDPQYSVVGVVADVKNGGLAGADEPEYYRLRRNRPDDWNASAVLIFQTSLPPDTVAKWIHAQLAALDPTVPVQVETVTDRVRKFADQPLFETALVGLFASTGLLTSMVGLYGVLAFLAARRRQEMGLRMALGATRYEVARLMVSSGMRMVLPGMSIGLLTALAASRVLSTMLFNVGPHDPATFAVACALLVGIATIATLAPAIRSAQLDPMEALREE